MLDLASRSRFALERELEGLIIQDLCLEERLLLDHRHPARLTEGGGRQRRFRDLEGHMQRIQLDELGRSVRRRGEAQQGAVLLAPERLTRNRPPRTVNS